MHKHTIYTHGHENNYTFTNNYLYTCMRNNKTAFIGARFAKVLAENVCCDSES